MGIEWIYSSASVEQQMETFSNWFEVVGTSLGADKIGKVIRRYYYTPQVPCHLTKLPPELLDFIFDLALGEQGWTINSYSLLLLSKQLFRHVQMAIVRRPPLIHDTNDLSRLIRYLHRYHSRLNGSVRHLEIVFPDRVEDLKMNWFLDLLVNICPSIRTFTFHGRIDLALGCLTNGEVAKLGRLERLNKIVSYDGGFIIGTVLHLFPQVTDVEVHDKIPVLDFPVSPPPRWRLGLPPNLKRIMSTTSEGHFRHYLEHFLGNRFPISISCFNLDLGNQPFSVLLFPILKQLRNQLQELGLSSYLYEPATEDLYRALGTCTRLQRLTFEHFTLGEWTSPSTGIFLSNIEELYLYDCGGSGVNYQLWSLTLSELEVSRLRAVRTDDRTMDFWLRKIPDNLEELEIVCQSEQVWQSICDCNKVEFLPPSSIQNFKVWVGLRMASLV